MRILPFLPLLTILALGIQPVGPEGLAEASKPERSRPDEPPEGALEEFEKEAARKERDPESRSHRRPHCDEDDDDGEDLFVTACLEMGRGFLFGTLYGGMGSLARMEGVEDEEWARRFPKREPGEPVIPFAALDVASLSAGSDVTAVETRIELGYGPLGVLVRDTRYRERDPVDTLGLLQVHLLYRMSFSRGVEIDLGGGTLGLRGNRGFEGFSFTVPVRLQASEHLGLEYRPAWGWIHGNVISDHALSLGVGARFVTVRAGYRWVSTGDADLGGPMIGAGIHF